MKKWIRVMLIGLMTLGLVACGNKSQTETGKDKLDEIKERGYLLVGTEGTYAPNSYHDADNKLVGFDVEVAATIAKHLGVEVKYVETEWASIFAA